MPVGNAIPNRMLQGLAVVAAVTVAARKVVRRRGRRTRTSDPTGARPDRGADDLGQYASTAGSAAAQDDVDERIAELQERVDELVDTVEAQASALAGLENDTADLQALLDGVSRGEVEGHDTLQLSGMNLQITNGRGATETANGLGNVIVGYNGQRSGEDRAARTGSHYLVVGDEHEWTRHGGIVAGFHNTASGSRSASVIGGRDNTANGRWSSVSGGNRNTASGAFASVSGGSMGAARGTGASVSGGQGNTAAGRRASVSGGRDNTAAGGTGASVSGGRDNTASALQASSVTGGSDNTASGDFSVVSGGRGNRALGLFSSVLGGHDEALHGNCYPPCP